MNKKFMSLLLIFIIIICVFTGCSSTTVQKAEDLNENSTEKLSMFIEIENTNNWSIVYHKETNVMYAVSNGSYSRGIFTLLVDENGNPLLYKND